MFNMRKKIIFAVLVVFFIVLVVGAASYKVWLPRLADIVYFKNANSQKDYSENDRFRNQVIKFVRETAEKHFENKKARRPADLEMEGNWEVSVTAYYQGEIKGYGDKIIGILASALEEATKNALRDERAKNLDKKNIKEARFLVKFLGPENQLFSFIETIPGAEGKELIDDLLVIRNLDKELIKEKIKQGKEYLLRMIDENENGAHKYYYAVNDSFENRLHTIYTSSLIYTLLKIHNFEKNDSLLEQIFKSAEFVFSMQNKEKGKKGYGAFYYSYFLDSKEKEKKFVVGTTAKTIFTLLELYKLTGDSKYLESAELGADWLITMQKPDGSMKSYLRYSDDGKWVSNTKESLLYNGQVLSAFSRIYDATKKEEYYEAAKKIAENFTQKIEKEGCYLGDDYRTKNPISSSWAVMSLLDFYKISREQSYKDIIFKCSEEFLGRQIINSDDILDNGRWQESYSTSGNGWISEVMGEVYKFCKEQGGNDCDKYKNAMIKAFRLLIQNTYSEENTYFLKNPEMAKGGVFWNRDNRYIRTDSVCHGLNAYLGIIDDLEEGVVLSIPEKPIKEILEEFKK